MTRVNIDPTGRDRAVYVISVAAELAGLHPQTLRIYERKGLVDPARTGGGSRRYSENDVALLQRIQELTNDGLNLAGVKRVLELEARIAELTAEIDKLTAKLEAHSAALVPLRQSVVVYREQQGRGPGVSPPP